MLPMLMLLFAAVGSVHGLLRIEIPLHRDCEIAGMSDARAQELIENAVGQIRENLALAEALCSTTDTHVDGAALSAIYTQMLNPIVYMIARSFAHYAWYMQPERFKTLSTTILRSIASSYTSYCRVECGRPAAILGADYAQTLDQSEQSKDMIHLMFAFPKVLPSFHPFMSAAPELLCARLINDVGHELGHVLNEYRRPSTMQPVRLFAAVEVGLPLLSAAVLHYAPVWCTTRTMQQCCGGVALCYAAAATTIWWGRVASLRTQLHRDEYKADAVALLLAPRSMRNGGICWFIEAACNKYYCGEDRLWARLQSGIKKLCILGYDNHPPLMDRMGRVCTHIVEATPPDQQKDAIDRLEGIAQAALKNYVTVYRNEQTAINAAKKAEYDAFQVFNAIRARYKLTGVR